MDRYNEQQEYQNKLDVCEAKKLHLDARTLGEQKKRQTNDLILAKQKLEEEQKVYDDIMRRQNDIAKTSQQLAKGVAQKVTWNIIKLLYINNYNNIYEIGTRRANDCVKKTERRGTYKRIKRSHRAGTNNLFGLLNYIL